MRIRNTGLIVLVTFLAVVSASAIFAQQRRTRPAPAAAPAPQADLTIKFRSTTSGQSYESTTMIKGKRERSEMNMGQNNMTTITQCDLKRTIQISDSSRKYFITPMETGNAAAASSTPAMAVPAEPTRAGGTVNYVTTTTDTGERKEMFGFTARHVKSSITMESSPDACSPVHQKMDTDGWYIDLTYGFDCDLGATQMANRYVPPGGCRDRAITKQLGTGRKGYPLIETMTMYGPNGQAMFTSTKEVLELSRAPLDAALFDLPVGYTEASSSQELYGAPSMASIMAQANESSSSNDRPSTPSVAAPSVAAASTKSPGTLRVGVVAINNRTDRPVSVESLRQRLIRNIQGDGIDAVALNATSPAEIEAEAKSRQCDFILYTDLNGLKISAAKKLGGFLGRAAGVGGAEKTESRVDYKLFAVGEPSPRLQSSANAKEEGDEVSAGAALDNEAGKVSAEVRKKARG
jgi:hypothetical protein